MSGLTIYVAPGERTSPLWARAFMAGYPGKTFLANKVQLNTGSIALFGSPRFEPMMADLKSHQADWFYGDHGFFGRGKYYRCARNATMFDGTSGDDDPGRFRAFNVPINDWRRSGSHIVVCPNSEAYLQRHGLSCWVTQTQATLRKFTDRPIHVRWKHEARRRPLHDDLRNAWAVVAFCSNAAVEAVLAGIPVFCLSPCAALTMGSSDLSLIESPLMPDCRETWAARLANNQWTFDEMARGMLWRTIGR